MTPDSTDDRARKDALIEQAYLAFERESPLLWPEHAGEWVAYHGGTRIGFGKTRAELWQACLRRGLPEGEFWVFDVQPIVGVEAAGSGMMKMEYFDP